jgi:uncharacterized protein (DUF2336 family)
MTAVSRLLQDIDQAMATRPEAQRSGAVTQVARLFTAQAASFSEEQVDLFDAVLGRLAANAGPAARLDLSQMIAPVANAPYGVVRQLAMDDIQVARPVLTQSPRLSDKDLIAVAAARGRDHMLALTERPNLAEPVTDYLVVKGDSVVSHGLAGNTTARFSTRGMGLLVTRAMRDEALQGALGLRRDIPADLAATLADAARENARRRLMERPSAAALAAAAPQQTPPDTLSEAAMMISGLAASGRLTEARLAAFAAQRALPETVCALSALGNLSTDAVEQMLMGQDRDALLVLGRSQSWSWSTIRALIGLRPAQEQAADMIARAKASYENLSPATAQRVVQFMRLKDRQQSGG